MGRAWAGVGAAGRGFALLGISQGSLKTGDWNPLKPDSLTCLSILDGNADLEAGAAGAPQASRSLCGL